MPYFDLGGARLYYEEQGQGRPVLFIHGVWMSSRFFRKQMPYFGERYHAIALDLRSHGRSSHTEIGNTVATYAQDLRAFIQGKELTDVIMVGWSMGAFVIWDYLRQFGPANVKGIVVVDESASDFKWPDWPIGSFDIQGLHQAMTAVQTDRGAFASEFIPLMFKDPPAREDFKWMLDEVTMLPESIAAAILFDQTLQDYRPVLPEISVPTLLCFGRDEKLVPIAGGEHLQKSIPGSRLIVFENSGHCSFLEEPERFNGEVDSFIRSI